LSPFGPLDFFLAASTGAAYRCLGTFPDLIALRWNFSPTTLIAQAFLTFPLWRGRGQSVNFYEKPALGAGAGSLALFLI
jgi:hypothetical protein